MRCRQNRACAPHGSSRVWETAPVGGPPQPDYLNAVLLIETIFRSGPAGVRTSGRVPARSAA